MSKECPNCGKELDEQEKKCPDCGHELEENKPSKNLDAENSEKSENEVSSNFMNKEVNENIEWSELKDMSLGHVMNMFNEQGEPTEEKEVGKEKETAQKKEEVPAEENDIKELTNTDVTAIKDEEIAASEADLLESAEEGVSPLHQYIKEHKKENNEEKIRVVEEQKQSVELPVEAQQEENLEIEDLESVQDEVSDETELIKETVTPDNASEEVLSSESDSENQESDKTIFIKPDTRDSKQPIIPSKSKKPEEIEMDAAPIFYKETESESKESETKDEMLQEAASYESESKKKNKKRYIIAASVVVLATGGWFVYDQAQKNSAAEKKIQTEQLAEQKELATSTKEALENFFTDDSHVYIKPGMIGNSTATIKKNLDKLKDHSDYKEIKSLYDTVTNKQAEVAKVNQLFAQPIINGNKLNDVAIIADKKIDLKKVEEKDALDKLVNQAITEATNQYDQLQKAKEAVSLIYKENKVTDQLTLSTYDAAKAEVDKIKSATLRKPLSDGLAEANKVLVEAQKKEADAQAAANSAISNQTNENTINNQAQGASTTTQNATGFTPPNSSGVYTDPVYTVNPLDVADMSNPAWSWAPGVKEKVIATCIERGYIIEGGYVLEPARIINGEGYYNLYGTNNQSALLSGFSEKDFPVYLVTINAKTGWFKGNASRNAGG